VARVVRGVTYGKGDVVQSPGPSDVPVLRAGNINGRLITDRDLVWLPRRAVGDDQILKAGDVVMCMSSGSASVVGKSAQLNTEWVGSFGAFCAAVRTEPLRADPGFIAHVLATPAFRAFAGAALGNNIKNLNKSALEGYRIPLPSLDEQRRIVGLLDRAAEIRRRADAARAKARAIIPALFLDTFGDPATNPKGWPVVELGDVIARITGGKNIEAGNGTSKYRIMKVSAVTSGIFKAHEAKPAPDDHIPAEDHHVRAGDFLFSRANTSELVGAVAIADDVPAGLLLPDKIWRIEWTPTRIEPRYAYSLLRSSEIRRIFAVIGSGTSGSMKNISQAKLVRVPIPLPPLPIQTAFAEQTHRLDSLARHLDAAAAKAEAMAAGLSAEVFG
jgi:type I restriction enzyme S subunit